MEAKALGASPADVRQGSPHEERERAAELERTGRWAEAADAHRNAFHRALRQRELAAAADALYAQARALRGASRTTESEELAELCREMSERCNLVQTAARATNLLAILHFLRGDVDGAERLYADALEHARDVGDDRLIGFACQNLGVIANVRGDLREARLLYLESVGASVRSTDRSSTAMVYNNLGMICSDLEEYLEAEIYFDRGIEIAERIPDIPTLARLYANRAEPMIRVGDLQRAAASLSHAEELARPIDARSTLAAVRRYRGVLAMRRGKLGEAEQELTESLRLADEGKMGLARAEALEEISALRTAQHREADARAALEEARAAYAAAGAERDAARVERRLQGDRPRTDVSPEHR